MNDKPFLSIRQAAAYLGVEYKTVYRLVTRGELPAGKFGGQWRIRATDLEKYFEDQVAQARRNGAAEARAAPEPGALLRCGQCRQLISHAEDVAGRCQAPDCETPLCARCWGRGERFCRTHVLSTDDRLRQARDDLAAGLIPCLVTREQAHERELNLLRRFDLKVRRISILRDPFDETVHRVSNWSDNHTTGDEVPRLLDLVGTGFLEEALLRSMPLNRWARYELPRERADPDGLQGLVLEVTCRSRLAAHLRAGFDTEPLGRVDAQELLDGYVQQAETRGWGYVVGLASITGWDPAARDLLQNTQSGRAFAHRLVRPCLIDLESGEIISNPLDEPLLFFAGLFAPPLHAELVRETALGIHEALTTLDDHFTLEEVQDRWVVNADVAREAMQHAAETEPERFVLEEINNLGLTIHKNW